MGTNTSGLRRGGPGRPKGSKNKKTIERDLLTSMAKFLESGTYIGNIQARMLRGRAPHLENYFLPRLHGKPVEQVELTGAHRKPLKVIIEVVKA